MYYLQVPDEVPETRVFLQQSVQIIGHLGVFRFDLGRGHICAKRVVFYLRFLLITFSFLFPSFSTKHNHQA